MTKISSPPIWRCGWKTSLAGHLTRAVLCPKKLWRGITCRFPAPWCQSALWVSIRSDSLSLGSNWLSFTKIIQPSLLKGLCLLPGGLRMYVPGPKSPVSSEKVPSRTKISSGGGGAHWNRSSLRISRCSSHDRVQRLRARVLCAKHLLKGLRTNLVRPSEWHIVYWNSYWA